jgi:SulP family sulfate permease
VSGIKLPVERVLRKAGELEEGPLLRLYRTDAEALLAFGRVGAQPADPDETGIAR